MRLFTKTCAFYILAIGFCVTGALSAEQPDKTDLEISASPYTESVSVELNQIDTIQQPVTQYIAFYIHGNFRCGTCKKIQAFSEEVIHEAFSTELKSEKLEWRIVNMDKEIKYAEEYQLVSQALVLVEMVDGEQKNWKNLNRVWELVNNKKKFFDYVQKETRNFMAETK
jgi:hypothetical protein